MRKEDFICSKPFVVTNIPGFDWTYTEHLYGGEVRITNGKTAVVVEVEQITPDYFVIDCWLNRHTDGRIYFKNCELK
ncbi:MAG: hypothetical protein GX361_08675 [Bacteroidales bacterium]|nr:hypothetical protein [Bacteroidales bacterium]